MRGTTALQKRIGFRLLANRAQGPMRLRAASIVAIAVMPILCACAATSRGEETSINLRIAWGGGEARSWSGSIRVAPGSIASVRPLGIEPDEPGSMWIDGGHVVIRQRSARQYDGADIAVTAPINHQRTDLSNVRLIIKLSAADDHGPAQSVELDLARLVEGQHEVGLDRLENRLLIRRVPGDKLRVHVRSPSLVFAPGETLHLDVQPNFLGGFGDGDTKIESTVSTGRSADRLSSDSQIMAKRTGADPPRPVELKIDVPQDEGVYDLRITASRPAEKFGPVGAFRQRWEVKAERYVQFIVLGKLPPDDRAGDTAQLPSRELMEITPDVPWWRRVAKIPKVAALEKLPGLERDGPLENGNVRVWDHPQLGKMTTLAPSADEPNATWTAYPLEIHQPGHVHIVEVEYPSDIPQSMGISVLEPNATGMVLPFGLDSGVIVSEEIAKAPTKLKKHRLVVWPRTTEPILLITNQRTDQMAVHGRIRVLGPKPFGVAKLHLPGASQNRLPRALPRGDVNSQRMLAAYYGRPLFPENFSASESFDQWSQRSLDDWVTFYEGGTRLVEYLNYAGYNALVISALSDGSTIYPHEDLQPTPRYDTGAFFTSAQDPVRKDVLEMLLRLCDREEIRLIPSLELSSPLPELEAILRRGGQPSTGIELIGADGRTWMDRRGMQSGYTAHYNPLHPRVQQAILRLVRHVVDRYRHHPSFAGVAIGSSGYSYALLPGPDWGYDDYTVSEFSRATGIELPGEGPNRFAARARLLRSTHFAAWVGWRAERLRALHEQIAREVREARPESRLYLATTALSVSPDVEQMLRPTLPPRFGLQEVLAGMGVRPEMFHGRSDFDGEGIVLLRSQTISSLPPDRPLTTPQRISQDLELDRLLLAAPQVGSLMTHKPQQMRLTSFDRRSPFGRKMTHTLLASHLVPSGYSNRKRFVDSLSRLDPQQMIDGGWMVPLGQEDAVRDLVAAYRRLPAEPFMTVPGNHQPIIVRALVRGRHTYFYFVNDSSWSCKLTCQIDGADGVGYEELSGMRAIDSPRGHNWNLKLDAHDCIAVRFDAPTVALRNIEVLQLDDVSDQLRLRLTRLVERTSKLRNPRHIAVLDNRDFEADLFDGKIPGWSLEGDGGGIDVHLDQETRHAGKASARLSSRGNIASLISNSFTPSSTGRLSFTVWLKASPGFTGPLRLAISAQHQGQDFYRFGIAPKNEQWRPFQFQADDLPLDGLSDLQIRLDLMGAGDVWIDEIQVSDLQFNSNERTELSKILTLARFSLESGKIADCANILENYWPRFLEQHIDLPEKSITKSRPPLRNATRPKRAGPDTENEPWWKRRLPDFMR